MNPFRDFGENDFLILGEVRPGIGFQVRSNGKVTGHLSLENADEAAAWRD